MALLAGLLCLAAMMAYASSLADPTYTEVFYPSAGLRIQAYLYRPDGDGPFPVVIYNHGSRAGQERQPRSFSATIRSVGVRTRSAALTRALRMPGLPFHVRAPPA